MTPEEVRNIVREELAFMVKNKKLVFPYPIQILDGNDITLAKNVGTRIGTAVDQKLGFFGATPIVKHFDVGDVTVSGAAEDGVARGAINDIHALLRLYGLMI